ncbi:hypothetical protein SKAU_G00404240 [Synaphobranchus kaupii]|uniref:Ig-like domain-containing protein n=1 Tax=Synaphobranchus kaupii TaxID=118154 RepID=A0A9Q1IBV3_SYNKA|nr:hypothetical protein SKAU_G00404240 [Synaphobranchus kaupii]
MVDDVQVEYFDSNDNEVISRRHWKVEDVVEERYLKTPLMFLARDHIMSSLHRMKRHFNHTGVRPRVRVMLKTHPESGAQQVSCLATDFYPRHINMTLLRDGQTVPEERLITGELLPNGDGTYQQRKTLSLRAEERPERHNYTCTVTHTSLSNKLDITWVRPRIRVMLKTHPELGVQQMICLATGFYPRHINMTLLRDGQTVPEERLITGELLPNGDGTYQQRKTLSLSVEERPERHNYTCTVTHTSLSNTFNITWVCPRVRVMLKTHPESGAQQVSCLATGFYPRHINMTLLRDGQTVPEERLITGELLPNGDGTYQQRKTLSLSAEERPERHNYTCTVTHTSLSNKLDITWAVAAFIKWKRRSAVRPRIRVMLKTHPESGAQQVSCLATGFYPCHINMTLLRDGQTVPEERLITGELLPNGDGTYQQRKTLRLSAEERPERHNYTCTVTHTSLSNKLDITWAVAAFIKRKRRSAGQQGHVQPVYTASPVEDDTSS